MKMIVYYNSVNLISSKIIQLIIKKVFDDELKKKKDYQFIIKLLEIQLERERY